MNTKKTKKKRKRTTAPPPKSSHLLLLCLCLLLFSLSLSLSLICCAASKKFFQRAPLKKFCTKQFRVYNPNLLSSPLPLVLFLSKIFTFYIPRARIRAYTRGKKSERECREREIERERECACIYYSSFSERKEVKSNTIK